MDFVEAELAKGTPRQFFDVLAGVALLFVFALAFVLAV